jgi:hypothetical protein
MNELRRMEYQLRRMTNSIGEEADTKGLIETDDKKGPLLRAVSARDAVRGLRSSTGAPHSPEEENVARLRSGSLGPSGWLARTVVLLFFASIAFLTRMFVGGLFIADQPSRPPIAGTSVPLPIPSRTEAPVPAASTAGKPSPEPATSQPGPAVPVPTPASVRPAVAGAPPAPAKAMTESPMPSATVAPTPPPLAPAEAQPAAVMGVPAAPTTAPPLPSEAATSTSSPIAPAQAPAPVPIKPALSDMERQALLSQGDALLSAGDVATARLFYQRGADAGDGTAALRLGETFDAPFLEQAHLGRVPSDPKKAVSWYLRARALGSTEAEILLNSLHAN